MSDSPSDMITGWHGCDASLEASIREKGFLCSTGDDHWLGEGAYFFGEGISNPVHDAERWATAQAWDNEARVNKYTYFLVLKACIRPSKLLNATTDAGRKIINYARDEIVSKLRDRYVGGFHDHEIVKFLVNRYKFDVIIHDFYIMFQRERRQQIRSRYPNVRVICVFAPSKTVDKESIVHVKSGKI